VAHFDVRAEVLQGFTSSRKDLAAALGQLRVPTALSTLLSAFFVRKSAPCGSASENAGITN